jgi:sialic acid synthase SpsE
MASIKLGNELVGDDSEPYVIAEIGVNHENDMARAKAMIESAQTAGANAVKFQAYKADRLAARNSPAYWDTTAEPTTSQRTLFEKYDKFGAAEFQELAEHARRCGIAFCATPFDEEAVDFLDPLQPFVKIASADITHWPLLRKAAGKGKPIVLSTGAATIGEIQDAVRVLEEAGAREIALLHCILSYPTSPGDAHLRMIAHLRQLFPQHVIGYSDHTIPEASMSVITAAYMLGARVIEKHFTDDKTLPGNDHYHAMDERDLRQMRANLKLVRTTLGEAEKRPASCEAAARIYARRSLVASRAIEEGDVITEEALTFKRPGTGIPPTLATIVYGRRARRRIEADEILTWEMV